MQSELVNEIAKALVKAQGMMTPAIKDAKNPFLKTTYASLNSVLDSCRGALLENGIALVQSPVPAPEHLGGGFIGLETKLIHAESGQWISNVMIIPLSKPDPQAMGAAISYGRRYALAAMLGVVSGEDNDCETRTPARADPAPEGAPSLEGVNYSRERGPDGKTYITASGNTRAHREALKGAGFSWSEKRGCWYRAA